MNPFAPLPNLEFFTSEKSRAAMLSGKERLLLYALVHALEPERMLEIGFAGGGSARIILAALGGRDRPGVRLVSIDPQPRLPADWTEDARFTLLRGASPAAIPAAMRLLQGPLDLCFIDGNHNEPFVFRDSCGVADHVAQDGYILYHDALYADVQRAVDRFLEGRPDFIDCGLISRSWPRPVSSQWGGFRLLRRRDVSGPEPIQ